MLELVAAMDENRGIGWKGGLPWPRFNADMQHFRDLTLGSAVIMGRKTWESLPWRPLDRRINVVISSSPLASPDAHRVGSFEEAVQFASGFERAFFIGGAAVYAAALDSGLPLRLHLTRLEGSWPADVHFPAFAHRCCLVERTGWRTEGQLRYELQFWESLGLSLGPVVA